MREGTYVTTYQREHLIPRIARILYGDHAEIHEQLIAANVSLHYVSDPEYVAGTSIEAEGFEDTYEYMDDQAHVFESLQKAFRVEAESLDPGEANRSRADARTDAWTVFYYRYTAIAAAKATLEAGIASVDEHLDADRYEAAAELAGELLDRLPGLQRDVETVRERSEALSDRLRSAHLDAPPYENGWIAPLESFSPEDVEERLNRQLAVARSES